jgi:GAF domain-containing protein
MHDTALRTLIALGNSVLEESELELVFERVIDAARELTGARYAALGVLDDRRERLERFLTAGVDDETREMLGEPPSGHGVLGELIRNPEPLRLPDVGAHPRSYGFPIGHPPMATFLGVPILVDGQAWGNLYLTEKAGVSNASAAAATSSNGRSPRCEPRPRSRARSPARRTSTSCSG